MQRAFMSTGCYYNLNFIEFTAYNKICLRIDLRDDKATYRSVGPPTEDKMYITPVGSIGGLNGKGKKLQTTTHIQRRRWEFVLIAVP